MFENFEKQVIAREGPAQKTIVFPLALGTGENFQAITQFLERFGGSAFDSGMYRILDADEIPAWHERLICAFPLYRDRILPFGRDWLNRLYCIDLQGLNGSRHHLLLFSHITDEVLDIPVDFVNFNDVVVIEAQEGLFDKSMLRAFCAMNNLAGIDKGDCVQLKTPLFLGGRFELDNMALSDLEVEWNVTFQQLYQLKK